MLQTGHQLPSIHTQTLGAKLSNVDCCNISTVGIPTELELRGGDCTLCTLDDPAKTTGPLSL